MHEFPRQDECLNIVFRKGTPYVTWKDFDGNGKPLPYVLENVSWYKIKDGKLKIQFRAFYTDNALGARQNTGYFDMQYISRVYISKLK